MPSHTPAERMRNTANPGNPGKTNEDRLSKALMQALRRVDAKMNPLTPQNLQPLGGQGDQLRGGGLQPFQGPLGNTRLKMLNARQGRGRAF